MNPLPREPRPISAVVPPVLDAAAEGLREFSSETRPVPARPPRRPVSRSPVWRRVWIAGALLPVLVVIGLIALIDRTNRTPPPTTSTGALKIESDPSGAEVAIDGTSRGRTPLTLSLTEGRHELVLTHGGIPQRSTVVVSARGETMHRVAWVAAPAAPATESAAPPVAPPLRQTPPATPAATFGWLEVEAPLPLQIIEGGRVIGTTEAARTMLAAGRHELEFSSDAFGVRVRRTVDVRAGRTGTLSIPVDRVPVNLNATPWAEVLIDGTRAGETPLAAVAMTLGIHQIEFRHPELGRKTVALRVTAREPARLSVDMRVP